MILAFLAFFAAGAPPQAADDARALLQQVADAARATTSWHLEGEIVTVRKTESGVDTFAQPFRLYTRGAEMRYEVGGSDGTIVFRNGATLQQYSVKTKSYTRRDDVTGRYISGVLGWDVLAQTLMPTATMAGRDQVQFEGRSQVCELVSAELRGGTRTVCIDRARSLVLRDRDETTAAETGGQTRRSVRTVTYSRIDRNIPLEASLFQLPAGALERQPGQNQLPPGVTPAIAILRTQPAFTPEARAAQRQGTVLISCDVGADGLPHNVRVVRGLGLGLDERAVEAVEKWRFKPAEKDGKPIGVRATVEVNFRLIDPQR